MEASADVTGKGELDIGQWFLSLRPSGCGALFAADVADALSVAEQAATSAQESFRVITLTWREVPPLANELGLLVDALARAVPDFFPSLYGLSQQTVATRWSKTEVETEAHAITRKVRDVDGAACRRILSACHEGSIPHLGKLQRAAQARQLALAIQPSRLLVLIGILTAPAAGQSLRSLAQGVEWLAANTCSRVALFLPEELASRPELDHVSYGAALLFKSETLAARAVDSSARATQPGAISREPVQEPSIAVSPIVGRPAKHSQAEQALFLALTGDKELKPLFAFNQKVRTRAGTQPIVDLLWEQGRVVIEVDGREHRGVLTYAKDRERDLELLLTGYRVIRFAEGHVIGHLTWVVERIRDAVRFVRNGEAP